MLKAGDEITLTLERRPVLANDRYVEAGHETVQTFVVVADLRTPSGGWLLRKRSITSGNRYRRYRLSRDLTRLTSGPPRPLRYEVLSWRVED